MKQLPKDILNKKAFIFDVDGTLIDSMKMWSMLSELVIFERSGQVASKAELKRLSDIAFFENSNYEGNIYHLYYQMIIEQYGLNMTVEEFKVACDEVMMDYTINELEFKKGAVELLKFLKENNKKIAIATTTYRELLDIYSKFSLKMKDKISLVDTADVIVAFEDVKKKKPDPEAYQKAVDALGFEPKDCVAIEDSFNGSLSAKQAGLEVVSVYDESAEPEQDLIGKIVDYKVDSLLEFLEFFKSNYKKSGEMEESTIQFGK